MRTHLNENTAVPSALALLLAAASARVGAEEWATFHWRNPFPTGNSLGEIAFGDGRFVTVDGHGHLYSSTDGLGWTRQLAPAPTYAYAIGYGNGRFVTVGYFGTIVSSEGDGWKVRPSGNSEILSDVAYGNGWFVVVNNGNGVTRSQDGVTWTHISDMEPQPYLHYVVFGNGVFVGINHGPNALVSVDGAKWTAHGITAPANSHVGLTYAFGKFYVRAISYVGSGRYDSTTCSSLDGKTWSPGPNVPHPRGAAAGDDLVVMLTGRRESTYDVEELSTSSDGVTWVRRDAANQATLRGIAHGNGLFVGVGEQGEVVRSTNGIDWSRVGGDRRFSMNAGVYHDGQDVELYYPELKGIAFGGGTFLIRGSDGDYIRGLFRSVDGQKWTEQPYGTSYGINGLNFLNGTFMLFGGYGMILQSDPLGAVVLSGAFNSTAGDFEVTVSGGRLDAPTGCRAPPICRQVSG